MRAPRAWLWAAGVFLLLAVCLAFRFNPFAWLRAQVFELARLMGGG